MARGTKYIVLMAFTCFLASSCRNNSYKIDVSKVNVDVEILRLEKDLFEPDPTALGSLLPEIETKYGDFLQLFSYVVKGGDVNSPEFLDNLLAFSTDKQNNEVYANTIGVFPDIKPLEEDVAQAFRHILYYFPDYHLPKVYTCITGFNSSLIVGDSVVGIGLDRYLGRENDYYPRLGIYGYLSARMNPYNILPDLIYYLAATEWDIEEMDYMSRNALTEIIHEGKNHYFQKCMLPEVSDTLLFGFSADQLKFCMNNEQQMWQYLVEHDMLFSTDPFTIRKLTGESPFTSFFTNESPGRAATWLGFRIVESYMNKNNNLSLADLMQETDCQKILERAQYTPL